MQKTTQIAIDGPAGAGKSSVAKRLAAKLGYIYIDTGAMYRTITLLVLQKNIALDDEAAIKALLKETVITFGEVEPDGTQKVYYNGNDCTEEIRSGFISNNVSAVSALPLVRSDLVAKQQQIAGENNVVMDGRDIGTVVLPNAQFKFFLTASLEERTKRRLLELEAKGQKKEYAVLLAEIEARDKMDSERAVAPLKAASDALVIDTSKMSLDEVIENLFIIIQK